MNSILDSTLVDVSAVNGVYLENPPYSPALRYAECPFEGLRCRPVRIPPVTPYGSRSICFSAPPRRLGSGNP